MLTVLKRGRIVDPVNGRDEIGDVFIENGRIVAPPENGRKPDESYDLTGKVVMAGAIDVHSHIAGGNVNTARLLMPELRGEAGLEKTTREDDPAALGAYATGLAYARMGFTTVIEPAVLPTHALHAHIELSDIPIIDVAGLVVLGNDDYLLGLLRDQAGQSEINDYVAWTLDASKCLGIKVINAGGAAAFKFNARTFGLDDEVPAYGLTSRRILTAIQRAVAELGIPHPPHVHCSNLGIAGNIDTALRTMDAAEQLPMHFAHIQFYAYGDGGDKGFSSAAPRLMEGLRQHPNATVDVGQVMFGQTVTISGDVLRQFDGRKAANPKKWVLWDGDGNGGGLVPYRYKSKSFVNAVQWAIGLEIFLLADDLWRVLFTTDHPNGAIFTRYPEIFELLMSRDARARWIEKIPEAARRAINLAGIGRELTLNDIAVMTRGAPARLLGLTDRGHLGPGAVADVAVYTERDDKRAMFAAADLVLKDGRRVVENGEVVAVTWGRAFRAAPAYDQAVSAKVKSFYDTYTGVDPRIFTVPEDVGGRGSRFGTVPCRS